MTENTVTGVTPDELPEALRLDRERTAIDEAADAYYEEYLALHPDAATIEGRPGHETEYSDYSPAGEEADVELAQRNLEAVNALVNTPLMGFSGESLMPTGKISLPLLIGDDNITTTTIINKEVPPNENGTFQAKIKNSGNKHTKVT